MQHYVTDPQGIQHIINAPDGATEAQIMQMAPSLISQGEPQSWGDAALNFLPHQAGLLANAAISGATALPTMIGNIPGEVANATRWAGDKALGIDQSSPSYQYQQPFDANLVTGENGKPQNAAERLEQDIVRPIAGIATGGAAAGETAVGIQVPKVLGQGMPMQYASGVTGGAASGLTREGGGTPNEQMAAALIGGMAPSIGTLGVNLGKQLMRGGDKNIADMQSQIDAFKKAGISPTVGQAAGGKWAQALESILGKLPGSSGMMAKVGETQQTGLGNTANQIADSLAPNVTPEMAGRAIKSGIEESYLPSQQAIQGALYGKLDSYIPPNTQIPVPNTTGTISQLAAPIPGMPALSNTPLIRNNAIGSVDKALTSDLGGSPAQPSTILGADGRPFTTPAVPPSNTMPYTALKQLRSGVGAQIATPSLISDIPIGQLKQVYAAASQDMGAAAKTAGVDAENTANQANAFTKNFHDEADLLNPIINQATPEQIYRSALSGSQTGGTKLGLVMASLPTQEREVVAAQALKDLGDATPANQNAAGNAFSGNSFMTRWNKLSDSSKKALFSADSVGSQNSKAIDNLANVADTIKQGSKVLANPSGTSPAAAHIATAAEFLGSLLSGNVGDAATLGGGLGSTRLMAHIMTNPKMVQAIANPKWSYAPNLIGTANAGANGGN